MSSQERDVAERELTRLINRALRSVPFVKLDKVDEVTALFEQAIHNMESNCILDADERDRLDKERKSDWGTAELQAAARAGAASGSDEEDAGRGASRKPVDDSISQGDSSVRPLPNRAPGNVTRDYSSPKGKSRGLTKKHGQSSRAAGGSSRSGADAEVKVAAMSSSDAGEGRPQVGLGSGRGGGSSGPLRQALLTRAAGTGMQPSNPAGPRDDSEMDVEVQVSPKYTQDYSSPRRKVRQLADSPDAQKPYEKQPKQQSSRATVSVQRFNEPKDTFSVTLETKNAKRFAQVDHREHDSVDHDVQDKSGSDGDEEDEPVVISTQRVTFDTTKMVASPKAFHASKRLLQLASPTGSPMVTAASGFMGAQQQLESKLVSPLGSPNPNSGTPKPAFLRRLDSPQSHHGKLLVAKTKLTNMLNTSLRLLPKLKPEAFAEVKRQLLEAVQKLETGTVSP